MTPSSSDCELVGAYVAQGSETAFRALVLRHVDLVYATALRQVGDSGIAEEITQNVFVTLAKKAPRLGGVETLAGWLHRAAILEAKARVRHELRRKQREETAAALAEIHGDGESSVAPLIPLLDEALLHLRDADRLALVLRFLEERSLRDVGVTLGVDEDAARKRVSRALDRLSEFFRRRGFAVPVGMGCATLLANSTKAAPAGLAASSAAKTTLSTSSTIGGIKLILFHLMALSKTQVTVICLLLAAGPLLWQRQAQARIDQQLADAQVQLKGGTRESDRLAREVAWSRESVERTANETQESERRLANLNAQAAGRLPPPVYQWDDSSPLLRIPKTFVKGLRVPTFQDKRGQLRDEIKEVLQLTEGEAVRIQSALDRFRKDVFEAQAKKMRLVEPTKNELQGRTNTDVRVFEMPDITDTFDHLRTILFSDIETVLGPERFPIFREKLIDLMPITKGYGGMHSNWALMDFGRREQFGKPSDKSPWLTWGVTRADKSGNMSSSIQPEEIPDIFRPYLQDWIDLAKNNQAVLTNSFK